MASSPGWIKPDLEYLTHAPLTCVSAGEDRLRSAKHVFLNAQLVRSLRASMMVWSLVPCWSVMIHWKKIRRNSLFLFTVPSYIPSLGNSQWQARAWGSWSHRIHGHEAESLSSCFLEREKKIGLNLGGLKNGEFGKRWGRETMIRIYSVKIFSIWKGESNKCIYTSPQPAAILHKPRFVSQHLHSNSQISITPGPRDLTPFSDLRRHQAGTQRHTCKQNMHKHKIKINFKKYRGKILFQQKMSKEELEPGGVGARL